MKRKAKRFDVGGDVESSKTGLFAAKEPKMDVEDDRFKSAVQANTKLPSAKEKTGTYGPSSSSEPASFKEAFAAARKAGDSSFSFGGKKFTTETAGAKKPSDNVLRNAADEMEKGRAVQSRLSESIRDDEARVKSNYLKNRDLPTVERQRHFEKMASDSDKYRAKNRGTTISGNTAVYGMKKGGVTKSASSRADGCAVRGKTRGKMY